jgi:DNA-binding beta-propeller fold protein YncE
LQLVGPELFITMAGTHQIWRLDLLSHEVSTFAGSGREARQDGALLDAGFAQPSGIATDGKKLYVADSESNIIRAIDIASGQVETLVGGDLFEFGDVDGTGDDVRLQHPLGVVAVDDKILIADTYNHKIKELDPKTRAVKTFLGTGRPGQADEATSSSFYEPAGLTVANGKLYVADTNNHAVRIVDLKTKQTSTLNIKGLQPPAALASTSSSNNDDAVNAQEIKVAAQPVRENGKGALLVNVDLPAGYHLNPAAPQRYRVQIESGPEHFGLFSPTTTGAIGHANGASETVKNLKLPLRIPFQSFEPGTAAVRVQFTLFYCREDNTGTCRIKTLVWRVPVEVTNDASAASEITLQGKLTAE